MPVGWLIGAAAGSEDRLAITRSRVGNFGVSLDRNATTLASAGLGIFERRHAISLIRHHPNQLIFHSGSPRTKDSSPSASEETDELHPSRSPSGTPSFNYPSAPTMTGPPPKRYSVQPSLSKRPMPPSTVSGQPLFLPDSEEEGPSTSTRTPLFLPESGEGGQPRRKKRRISTKGIQPRTLDDLWGPREVSAISPTFNHRILIFPAKEAVQNQQTSSPPLPGPSSLQPTSPSTPLRYRKRGPLSRMGRKPCRLIYPTAFLY